MPGAPGQKPSPTRLRQRWALVGTIIPGGAEDVEAGAAARLAANRGRTLADQRERRGVSQRDLAERMGVPPERVAAIECAGPGWTEVRTLARYVQALGGRLEIVADLGDERVVLR
jgi:DNA-binding XRE family transcriptional regulator